ncbi:MAG: DnaJ C-terminal domain-containing protein [Phycisphaeraceae bacterium]
MAVKFEDYYQTLGVDRNASQDEIQKAFRKLARKYHPDVNKGPEAEQKFRQVSEAYEVLKDPEKRKKYDQLGADWKQGQDFRPPPGYENMHFDFGGPGASGGGFTPGGFSDFFEMFFGGRGPGGTAGRGGGGFEDLFSQMGGGRPGGGGAGFGQQAQQAPAQEAEVEISLQEAARGTTRSLALQGPQGRRTLDVKIPAGVTSGTKIRLRQENLVLKIKLARDPRFEVSGHDLTADVPIAPWEAALGGKVDVPTLEGKLSMTIPAGAQSGQKLRLRGKGLPRRSGEPGDLYARLKIAVPKQLSDKERKLYEQLREASDFDPRA